MNVCRQTYNTTSDSLQKRSDDYLKCGYKEKMRKINSYYLLSAFYAEFVILSFSHMCRRDVNINNKEPDFRGAQSVERMSIEEFFIQFSKNCEIYSHDQFSN